MKALAVNNSTRIAEIPQADAIELAGQFAWLLDDAFRIPGTNIRIGWDGLIGLIPGVGDVAASILALVPVACAYKIGASRWILARMLANVAIDGVVGAVPVVGDLFDVFFRSNRRNLALLKRVTDAKRR